MSHLQFPYTLHEAILSDMFKDPHVRPTIALLIVVQEKVLMLNSAHAHAEGLYDWWTLPQEGVKVTDGNLIGTTRRCMQEEFGYMPSEMCFYKAHALGDMKNHMPHERPHGNITTKAIRFIGVRMPVFPIQLDQKENRAYRFIASWNELDEAMEQVAMYRVSKYKHTCEAILRACTCGLLRWGVPRGLRSCSAS